MKYVLLIVVSFSLQQSLFAQDTIVQRNGKLIPSKVLEIDKSDVKYKKFENMEGPAYIILKNDVAFIRYQNGSVDTFNIATGAPRPSNYAGQPLSEMYLKGQQDAETYYTTYKPAANWTLGLTIPFNAFGIIPAVAFSATPPKKENLGAPDPNLLGNPDYYNGYIAKAKDKKGSKVMKSFAIGCLGSFVMYGTLLLLLK
jgi:hypothetical protein